MKRIAITLIPFILLSMLICPFKVNAAGPETVSTTIPGSYFSGMSSDEILKKAVENGYSNAVINSDGSLTCTMPKATHDELLTVMNQAIDETVADMITGKEAYSSFKAIVHDDGMTTFNIAVDASLYENSFDYIGLLTFYKLGADYQTMNGIAKNDINIYINVLDMSTGLVIDSGNYKDYVSRLISIS